MLLSFMVVLFTMTVGYTIISYTFTHKRLIKEAYKNLYNYADLSSKALEDRLGIITNTFHGLENSPEFMSFYNDVSQGNWTNKMTSYIHLNNFITNTYYENYDYIDSIFISIKEPDISVFKRHELFTDITFDYDSWWNTYEKDTNHYQWSYNTFDPVFKTATPVGTITLFRFIGDRLSHTQGAILFNIKQNQFNDILLRNSLYDGGYFFIMDKKGQVLSFNQQSESYNISQEARHKIMAQKNGAIRIQNQEDLALVYTTLKGVNWNLCYVVKEDVLFKNYKDLLYINYTMILLILVPAIFMSIIIIRKINKHIHKLMDQAESLEKGILHIPYKPSPFREIDILNSRFYIMATRINNLLHNIKVEKEKEKELELALLQAQINPHFLYNTLFSLKQQCLMEGSSSSAQLIQNLSDFYRISLSKGSNLITLEKEFQHIKNYIAIEQSKSSVPFIVSYDIDPYLLDEKIVKLTMQPIIENAIHHGIKNSKEEGVIHIGCQALENYISIEVHDNGCGISKDTLVEINDNLIKDYDLNNSQTHYGLSNVNHRLKLYFGSFYGIRIESQQNSGTIITLKIPYSITEEE